jgi:hypothetical protein
MIVAILGGTFTAPPHNLPRAEILVKIPATSGATIGEVTFGTPESGIAEIVLSKTSSPSFMITSNDLSTLEDAFYELNVTIEVFNESGEFAGMAQLQLVIDGRRNPATDNNVATLDEKLPKGTYQVIITVSYWTGAVTESIANSFTIHVIPRATKK